MQNWIDLFRVALPLVLLLGLLPVLALRCGDKWPVPLPQLLVPSFLRTALFLQLSCLLLGSWRLCLPGMVFALYIAWLVGGTIMASRKRWLYNPESWSLGYTWLLRRSEQPIPWRQSLDRVIFVRQGYLFFGLLAAGVCWQMLWQPVHNLRFLTGQGYERTLSLQALVNGAIWPSDGSVALLAPVVYASGLDAATVVRLTTPLLFLCILASIGYCVARYGGSPWASTLAVALFWMYSRDPGYEAATATGGAHWTTLFLLLAIGAARNSLGYAACAVLLAWLTGGPFPELFPVAGAAVLAALLVHGLLVLMPGRLRQFAHTGLVFAAGLTLILPVQSVPADGPFQYESAAQTALRISRGFRRNRWLLVSPPHEVAFSYGRGWHLELPRFLQDYPLETVADPAFRLKLEVQDVFVFVEKRPLPQGSKLAVPGNGEMSYYYSTNAGRASMAFRAAEWMAAYRRGHTNSSVYFEDNNLVVYRIAL